MTTKEALQNAGFPVFNTVRNTVKKQFPANSPKEIAAAFNSISNMFAALENSDDPELSVNEITIKTETMFNDKAQTIKVINFYAAVLNQPF